MDEPHQKLRHARLARGYATAADAAKAHGWAYQTYLAHENGTRGIRSGQAKRYERALGISAGELLGLASPTKGVSVSSVEVVGEAAAGVWREERIDTDQMRIAIITPPMTGGGARTMRKAVRMADNSMELAGIMPGDYAVYINLDRQLQDADIVYVRRQKGGLIERSIRQVVASDGGKITLRCRSHDTKSGTAPVSYPGSKTDAIEIIGRVVGSYREM